MSELFFLCQLWPFFGAVDQDIFGFPVNQELFCHVVPYHCLACVWSRRNKIDGGAPTVSATVDQFNRVCMLVTTTVLKGIRDRRLESNADRPSQRAFVLQHWLQIAQVNILSFSSVHCCLFCDRAVPQPASQTAIGHTLPIGFRNSGTGVGGRICNGWQRPFTEIAEIQ